MWCGTLSVALHQWCTTICEVCSVAAVRKQQWSRMLLLSASLFVGSRSVCTRLGSGKVHQRLCTYNPADSYFLLSNDLMLSARLHAGRLCQILAVFKKTVCMAAMQLYIQFERQYSCDGQSQQAAL